MPLRENIGGYKKPPRGFSVLLSIETREPNPDGVHGLIGALNIKGHGASYESHCLNPDPQENIFRVRILKALEE